MGVMRPGIARLFVAVVVLGCGGATCLYSGAGPIEGGGRAMRGTWNPALAFIADLLTVPIPTAGIADVRDVALSVTAGILLILAGVTRSSAAARSTATRWIGWCAAIVIALSMISALAWRSFDLSWGWIVRFAAGAALAIVISHRFTPAMVRQTIAGLLVVAVLALALSILHRADRGYAHFTWPIGPITIVGGLAAVWAALAGVWGVGLAIQRRLAGAVFALGASGICLYALQQTDRRSPAMGLIAAIALVGVITVWRRYPNRGVRVAVVAALAALAAGGVAYVARQAKSADRETSGPIAVRKAYWEHSAKFIGAHPFFGIGPDRFVIDMTMAIAPLRAEMPHVYHGNIDTTAHNEWLQATVELGLPAGLAYAALPIGVLFLALRSSQRSLPGEPKGLVFALAAALIALAVCEAASINLRAPILPIWYWTLLGLLASACQSKTAAPTTEASLQRSSRRSTLLVASAVACFVLSARELAASVFEALPFYGGDGHASSRLFVERTLNGRYEAARYASDGVYELNARPTELWKELFDLLPVYRDTAARYAASLIKEGSPIAARMALESVISTGMSPYDLSANKIYADLLKDDPIGQFRCAQRSLRIGTWRDIGADKFKKYTQTPEATKVLELEVAGARLAAKGTDPALLHGATVELLRINALLQFSAEKHDIAIADQLLAAECYRRLERENSPYRRHHDAEWDAFYTLARMYFESNPANYRVAYDAIVEAERYAVLGIKHEKVLHPDPSGGFIGGEVVPTELPERLRPLWRLSAMLHMAMGKFEFVELRILASLPPKKWTRNDLEAEIMNLARSALSLLDEVPREKRPPYYHQLAEMAGLPTTQMQPVPGPKP
jgi:O-antigen ligase/polysaccharide polymerase Wzy-like membrane protein